MASVSKGNIGNNNQSRRRVSHEIVLIVFKMLMVGVNKSM